MKRLLGFIIAIAIILSACSPKSNPQNNDVIEEISMQPTIQFNPEEYKEEDIVFYNLFSPVDLTYLITKDQSFYNSLLLNPLNNITKYNESFKAALNLGVYGADLSYLWLFDQSQQAHSYLTAIQQLSDQLGIPREFVDFTYADAESNSNELDSLIRIARDSYYTAEKYLKDNGRDYAASLILLGGWIETLYIAVNMNQNPTQEIMSRIATQKFSSNSLYKLLQNTQNETSISEYLLLVKKMNNLFEDLEIMYPPKSLVIDTANRKILLADGARIELSAEQIEKIRNLTIVIRNHIID